MDGEGGRASSFELSWRHANKRELTRPLLLLLLSLEIKCDRIFPCSHCTKRGLQRYVLVFQGGLKNAIYG